MKTIQLTGCLIFFIFALFSYLLDFSTLFQIGIALVLLAFLFCTTQTEFFLIYLVVFINLLFLFVCFWLSNGQISYLSDQNFYEYYKKTILLESMFWSVFGALEIILASKFHSQELRRSALCCLNFSASPLAWIGFVILFAEIILSYESYFHTYAVADNTGTLLYELGCMFVALSILTKAINQRKVKFNFYTPLLEAINCALCIFITMGSGKRLPLTYIILAYVFVISYRYGKFIAGFIYFVISIIGFFHGIFRDLLDFSSLGLDSLIGSISSSNQGGAFHASGVYLRIIDEGLISFSERLISFFSNFFGALFLPFTLLPDVAQINIFSMSYYSVQGNGGFIGSYSFFFLGWIGILVLPLLFLCPIFMYRGRFIALFSAIVLMSSPRWVMYNIGPIFRLFSMIVTIVFVLEFIRSSISHPRKNV